MTSNKLLIRCQQAKMKKKIYTHKMNRDSSDMDITLARYLIKKIPEGRRDVHLRAQFYTVQQKIV